MCLRIPNSDRAEIDPAKIRDYLLSEKHPVGRFKARFFRRLGYEPDDWARFTADLMTQHLGLDVYSAVETPYGIKYEIRGTLVGPAGRSGLVVSIWIVLAGEGFPRFVTAYPGGTS